MYSQPELKFQKIMKHFRQIEAENTKAKLELVSNSTTLIWKC